MEHQGSVVLFTGVMEGFLEASTRNAADLWQTLERARAEGLLVVLSSHHTRAELAPIEPLLHRHVFIVENGGGMTLPMGEVQTRSEDRVGRPAPYEVLPLGRPYREVVNVLRARAARLQVDLLGFDDLAPEQVARECGITVERACRAKRREFDEPFRVLAGSPATVSRLWHELRREGLRGTPGATFHHVTGGGGIPMCVELLRSFLQPDGRRPLTVGIGTDLRDRALLRAVDVPLIIPNDDRGVHPQLLRKLSNARVTSSGTRGWTEAVTDALLMMEAEAARRRHLGMHVA